MLQYGAPMSGKGRSVAQEAARDEDDQRSRSDHRAKPGGDESTELGPDSAGDGDGPAWQRATRALERALAARFDTQLQELQAGIASDMGTALRDMEDAMAVRITNTKRRQCLVEHKVAGMDARQLLAEARLEKLEKELAMVQSPAPIDPAILDTAWDRAPNTAILRLNTPELAKLDDVQKVVKGWLDDEFRAEQWDVVAVGGEPTKNFALRFSGAEPTASRRARKALDGMRRSDGTWRKLGVAGVDGASLPLYVHPDKSPQQNKIEALCRRAARAIKEVHPTMAPHLLRASGVVSVQWQKLLRIRAPTWHEAILEFNESAVASLRIDRQRVAAIIDVSGAAATDFVEWTS